MSHLKQIRSACSRASFLSEVSHLSVLFWLAYPCLNKNSYPAGKPIQMYRFLQGTPVQRYTGKRIQAFYGSEVF
jgi:hypothetical protein